MTQTIWRSTVEHIGDGAAEMFEAGVYIFFGRPVPDALADISLVHAGPDADFAPLAVGDTLWIAESSARITDMGAIANDNFEKLGHVVVYVNTTGKLLPGAIRAEGELAIPQVGDTVVFTRPGA